MSTRSPSQIYPISRTISFASCVLFLFILAIGCYRHPLTVDFDRYMYEALVRVGKSESLESVYETIKHESPRAEASSELDSPKQLRELMPFFAIRPLYLQLISLLSPVTGVQSAINGISAASLFGIGVVVLFWTQRAMLTALLLAAYPVSIIGRMGGPDGLSAFLIVLSLWLIYDRAQNLAGIGLLFLSLGIRTDNLLLLLAAVAWLIWLGRISGRVGGLLAIVAIGVVIAINHLAGHYGWIVLFRHSFIGGRTPSEIPHTLTISEYLSAVVRGASVIFFQVSLWVFLGIVAWVRQSNSLLLLTGTVVLARFLLFPSPEARYLIWAFIITGVSLILSLEVTSGTPLSIRPRRGIAGAPVRKITSP